MSGNESIGRQERTIWYWKRLTLLGVPIVAILIFLMVLQPWGTISTPHSVMAKTYAATSDIKSYRFSGTSASGGLDRLNSQQTIEAEFASPDRYHIKMIENGQTAEFIIIGDKQYIGSGRPPGAVMYSFTQQSAWIFSKETALSYLDMLVDIQELPDEEVEGISCLHYLGKWDVEKQIAETKRRLIEHQTNTGIVPDEEEIDRQLKLIRSIKMEIELWIGSDDYLIRQMKMNGQLPDDSEGLNFNTVDITMKYYDFYRPITIEAPLDADGQLLPGWRIVDTS